MERQQIYIGDNLRLERKYGKDRFICSCGHGLGTREDNFKDKCSVNESPISVIGSGFVSSDLEMANKMCFREFFCPVCGIRLTTEVARVGDPYLWDFQPKLQQRMS